MCVCNIIAMLAAVVGAFLYLRIMLAMYTGDDAEDAVTGREAIPWSAALTIGITVAFTLVFGIFADPIIDLVNDASPPVLQAAG